MSEAVGRRPYVVVTGAIAAGASTLSSLLVERLGWEPHLEGRVDVDNPFFADAYRDFDRWGFHSQVFFLVNSLRRHVELKRRLLASRGAAVVEDRTPYEHTGAYLVAYEKLGRIPDREAFLLRNLANEIESAFLVPDLLIYRQMSKEQLTARVQERGRPGEAYAHFEVLDAVRLAFDTFVENWERSAKLVVPSTVDVLSPDQGDPLLDRIAAEVHRFASSSANE